MGEIHHHDIDDGLELVIEPIEGVRSVGLTWLIPAGSIFEPEDRQGLGAMWSELLLRGAGDMDSRAQADAFDRLGVNRGVSNGRNFLTISATMLGERLDDALGPIVDMVRCPRFDPGSIEPVRTLAQQSLASLADDPHERAVVEARRHHFKSPLNRSGLGTTEGLASITREDIAECWSRHAVPGGSILAIAGMVDPEMVGHRLRGLLAGWAGGSPVPQLKARGVRGVHHELDETNQVQIVVVHDAPAEHDEESILERVLGAVLSGGMSGRLFTEVRERRGLCYAVSSAYAASRDYGSVTAYVGTTPDRAQQSLDVLLGELERIGTGAGAVTEDEFARAILGLKSRVVFSGESTGARASSLASDVFRLGRARSLDEMTRAIDAVTLDALNAYASKRSLGRMTIQTLGPSALAAEPG